MNLPPVGLHYYVIVSALLFGLGAFGVISRRNAIAVLMSIELMLNAAALNFVAFWRYSERASEATGPVFALIIITVAAAEAAVGLAIILSVYRKFNTINVDDIDLMDG
jgi:NADH-quinone oxidoreductase subunit K